MEHTTQSSFDTIVAGFYQAAAGTIGWLDALVPFQHAFSAHAVHLHAVDLVEGRIAFSHVATDGAPEAELDYIRTYHQVDPRAGLVAALKPGEYFNCWEHLDDAFVARDPFYQDFLIPYGGRYVTGMSLLQDASLSVMLGVHRGHGSAVLNPEEIDLCKRLARHLTDALELHRSLIARQRDAYLGATVLSRLRAPVVLLDEHRQLRHANPSAEALIVDADALFVRNGLLYCRDAEDDSALLLALRDLLRAPATNPSSKPQFVRARSSSSGRPLGLYLQALRPDDTLHAFGEEPLALMTIHDRRARPTFDPFVVALAFGFTPAEARVAVATAKGASLEEVAEQHGVSINTVRSQMQAVLQKSGTERQAEMVSLLAGLPVAAFAMDLR